MPDKRADSVLLADNDAAERLSERGHHDAPLTDGLIALVGQLAVKEAMEEALAGGGEARPQDHAASPSEPTRMGVAMGKPLQLIKGAFYFIARCPVSGEILDAIPDEAAGTGAPLTGEWRVACADCNTTHTLDLSAIKPEQIVSLGPPTMAPDD
jgi:hypothetical protein